MTDSPAFRFVLMMGVVNLFADTTYEGGASLNGPFLGTLGASAAAVSIIAGLGEFLGYSLRSVSGYIADRTGTHWPVTFVGYGINLLAVPATGGYTLSMASNYNGVPRPAAVLVADGRAELIRRRETVDDLLRFDPDQG